MLELIVALFWLGAVLAPVAVSGIKLLRAEERKEFPALKQQCKKRGLWALAGSCAIVFLIIWVNRWTDLLWFREVGLEQRFWQVLETKFALFSAGFFFAACFAYVNAKIFSRATDAMKLRKSFIACTTGIFGLVFGFWASAYWQETLLFFHQVPFGKSDSVFGKDIAFYVFTYPVLDFLASFVGVLSLVTLIFTTVEYLILRGEVDYFKEKRKQEILTAGITHISEIGIVLLLDAIAWTWLARYGILNASHDIMHGAGWTDIHVLLPMYAVFMVVLVIALIPLAVSVVAKSHEMTWKSAALSFGGVAATWLVGVVIVPAVVQRVSVSPNEVRKETPYLERSIAFTRAAYGLDKVQRTEFQVKEGITEQNLANDVETLDSARLWDWHALLSTNNQDQVLRLYYTFADADEVRYDIDGRKVQLLYSSRELDVEKLAESAKTWQNQHLVYTHGFGGVANPVNVFTQEGLPDYWLKNVPPISTRQELAIRQPRIYFGEKTQNHIYVHTLQKEFDYPKNTEGENNEEFMYDGPAGIAINSLMRRLAFAWQFDGTQTLFSSELTPESRIVFHRDIDTRLKTIAPFFWWEDDLYQVIADGELWFMRDGYTVSSQYPYAKPANGINYIRNSVKATVNAYTGKVDLYIFDDADPIIRAYASAFPGMFKPASRMPKSLQKHVRYPEDLLRMQGQIYASYHMDNAAVFYNKEDLWDFATQLAPKIDQAEEVHPYYMVMALPGSHTREYVLVLPFTPHSTDKNNQRNNMVAWLAGRCDSPHYGELLLYTFPKNKQVFGPRQIGAKANEKTDMSKDLTLWNQNGSQVILGDMRVVPLSDSRLLYVQPLYLQATGVKMPMLKKVIVASGEDLFYEDSFTDGLRRLAGNSTGRGTATSAFVRPVASSIASDQPIRVTAELLEHVDAYLRFLQQGHYVQAGEELEKIRELRNKK